MADTNTQGVIAAARAAAPAVPGQQPAPVMAAAPVAPAPTAVPQAPESNGFGAPPTPNGFGTVPQPVAPVVQPQPALETDNTRTSEQFSKLTDTNQRLAQTNELLRQELQRLQQTRQPQFTQPQQAPVAQPQAQQPGMPRLSDYIEIDPTTGERYVNEAKFNAAVSDIYQKASRAEQVVQNYVQTAEQREIQRQNAEAYSSYPELNPNGGRFDPEFAKNTRAFVYDSLINPQDYGGRSLNFREAADLAATRTGHQRAVAQAIPTPSVNTQNQVQKEQAAASVPSVPQQVSGNIDQDREYQRLVMGTRTGHDEAIAVRLKNAIHRAEDVDRQGQS